MKRLTYLLVVMVCGLMMACNGGSETEPVNETTGDLTTQERAELVATALSAEENGVEDDIDAVIRKATGRSNRLQNKSASVSFSVSVTVDFYDARGVLQDDYDEATTDSVAFERIIQGQIQNGQGYFNELNIDNHARFTVSDLLSRTAIIDGTHTNYSSYSRTRAFFDDEINYELDSELILTAVAVDLDAEDTFPESGVVEGHLEGAYRRTNALGEVSHEFSFHFTATFIGDNTAEVELADGTIFIVRLDTGDVEDIE